MSNKALQDILEEYKIDKLFVLYSLKSYLFYLKKVNVFQQ